METNNFGLPAGEQIQMMRRCSDEIKTLRAQIARLQPKADAYDNLSALIGMFPRAPQGYSEDLAWLLDKHIREIEENIAKETQLAQPSTSQERD